MWKPRRSKKYAILRARGAPAETNLSMRPPNRFEGFSRTLGKTSLRAMVKAIELYDRPSCFSLAYSSNSRIDMRQGAPCRPGPATPEEMTELKAFSYTRGTAESTVGQVSPALSTSLATDSAKIIVRPLPSQGALMIWAKECANGRNKRWLSSRESRPVPTTISDAKMRLSLVIITPLGTPVVPD